MPLFLPHLGCGQRCHFCAQNLQTGLPSPRSPKALEALLHDCAQKLRAGARQGQQPPELAFYGGTFTALAPALWQICLDAARDFQKQGLICGFRCSTRPDALSGHRLAQLRASGCQVIELGIQSFNDCVLAACGRGHDAKSGLMAISSIRHAGMAAGVHLMPGLPGSTANKFLRDVRIAIKAGATCLRIHPCLVLEGTVLAESWQKGDYAPWDLQEAINATAKAWLMAELADVPVIRMGLAPEPSLAQGILSGPAHPAFGSQVIGHALLAMVKGMMESLRGCRGWPGFANRQLYVPARVQGCLWGWKGNLGPAWNRLGLDAGKIHYWPRDELKLEIN